jgi:hypothetical protein
MSIFGRRRTLCIVAIAASGSSLIVGSGLPFSESKENDMELEAPVTCWSMHEDLGFDETSDRLVRVVTSASRRRICAVSDSSASIAVLDLDHKSDGENDHATAAKPHVLLRLKLAGFLTAMSFSSDASRLAVAWSGQHAALYDIPSGTCRSIPIPCRVKSPTTCVSVSAGGHSLLLSGAYHCAIVAVQEGNQTHPGEGQRKKRKHSVTDGKAHIVHDFGVQENMLGSGIFGAKRLVLINRPWDLVVPQLPDALMRKVYGT